MRPTSFLRVKYSADVIYGWAGPPNGAISHPRSIKAFQSVEWHLIYLGSVNEYAAGLSFFLGSVERRDRGNSMRASFSPFWERICPIRGFRSCSGISPTTQRNDESKRIVNRTTNVNLRVLPSTELKLQLRIFIADTHSKHNSLSLLSGMLCFCMILWWSSRHWQDPQAK